MVNAANVTAAILSFFSLAFLAIALATNSWVRFDNPRDTSSTSTSLNPLVTDDGLPGLRLQYDLDYFGLWVGCHREPSFKALSCAFISSACASSVCWTRDETERTCKASNIAAIHGKCMAFRVTRAFTIIAVITLVFGAALLLVATCVTSRPLLTAAAALNGITVLAITVAFCVFYLNVFQGSGMNSVASMSWSLIMLIVSWPLAAIATIFSVLSALATPAKPYDYEESE